MIDFIRNAYDPIQVLFQTIDVYMEGRYVWNNDNSRATAYGLTSNERISVSDQVLPDLKFEDNAEVSFGVGKDASD